MVKSMSTLQLCSDSSCPKFSRSDVEDAVLHVFSAVLSGISVQRTDRFSALGGNSIDAINIAFELAQRLGTKTRLPLAFRDISIDEYIAKVHKALVSADASALASADNFDTGKPSTAQEQVWFLEHLEGGSKAYRAHAKITFDGYINYAILQICLDKLVQRHEVLRTAFKLDNGKLRRTVLSELPTPIQFIDLKKIAADGVEDELARVIASELAIDFSMESPPLFRWTLASVSASKHVLVISEHHAVHDGQSFRLMLRDFFALYKAAMENDVAALPSIEGNFSSFCFEESEWLRSAEYRQSMSNWVDRLAPVASVKPLFSANRWGARRHVGGQARVGITGDQFEGLHHCARELSTSVFNLALAAFAATCSVKGEQQRFLLGTALANRPDYKYKNTIGMFVNIALIPFEISMEETFDQMVSSTASGLQFALDCGRIPLSELIKELPSEHRAPGEPPFNVAFSFHDSLPFAVDVPGVDIQLIEALSNGSSKFDLNVVGILGNTTSAYPLELIFEYDVDLFNEKEIVKLIDDYLSVLMNACGNPRLRLSELLLDKRSETTARTSTTSGPLLRRTTAQEMFLQVAEEAPLRSAVVCDGVRCTYGELCSLAKDFSLRLRAAGAGKETVVPVVAERSLESIVAMLGCLIAGAAFCPIDLQLPPARVNRILAQLGSPVAVVPSQYHHNFDTECNVLSVEISRDVGAVTDAVLKEYSSNAAAYCIFTSGSTGEPKGVLVPASAVTNLIDDWVKRWPCRENETFSWWTSPSFDVIVFEMLLPLSIGATVAIPSAECREEPRSFLEWLSSTRVTTCYLAPHLARSLQTYGKNLELPSRILTGVEPINEGLLYKCLSDNVRLINGYGPTEATVYTTLFAEPLRPLNRPIPVGWAIEGTSVHLLDRQTLKPVKRGEIGEIFISGNCLARGYFGRPDFTAERFIACPYGAPGERMYRTGDLARHLANGNCEFVGRVDDQLKIRGYRVELGEIESTLREHPAVEDVACLGVGQADSATLVAVLCCEEFSNELVRQLKEYLRSRLPSYMVPTTFLQLPALPLTISGKLDKSTLKRIATEGTAQSHQTGVLVGEVEREIGSIWCDILGLSHVDRHDDFFEIGGHSLLAASAVARLRERFATQLSIRAFFANRTVKDLAVLLDANPTQQESTSTSAEVPLFLVHAADGDCLYVENVAYGLPAHVTVHGLEWPRGGCLPSTIEQLARHHIKSIKEKQAVGPYRVGGWSAGGAIAQEIARQLIESGDVVDFLTMIDCKPNYHAGNTTFDADRLSVEQQQIAQKIALLLIDHQPRPAATRTLLIVAGNPGVEDDRLKWRDFVSNDFSVRTFDANHYDIVSAPFVEKVAEEIYSALPKEAA